MLTLVTTSQFRKDYKRAKKRGYNMELLKTALDLLLTGNALPPEYNDHQLTGNMRNYRECHILPDWLLVYRVEKGRLVLVANRTGTHSDIFDE